ISGGIIGVDRRRDPGVTAGIGFEEGDEICAGPAGPEEAASATPAAVSEQRAVLAQAAEATAESAARGTTAETARWRTTTKSRAGPSTRGHGRTGGGDGTAMRCRDRVSRVRRR